MIDTGELPATYQDRFGGLGRLLGHAALERLHAAHVCVVGVGGVGSWTAEGLARSGVGALTLIDLDDVCVTNVNRQLPALDGQIGRPKVAVLAERARLINPLCRVEPVAEFFTAESAERLLSPSFDYVVDAIDRVSNKTRLIAECLRRGRPCVSCAAIMGLRMARACISVCAASIRRSAPFIRGPMAPARRSRSRAAVCAWTVRAAWARRSS